MRQDSTVLLFCVLAQELALPLLTASCQEIQARAGTP